MYKYEKSQTNDTTGKFPRQRFKANDHTRKFPIEISQTKDLKRKFPNERFKAKDPKATGAPSKALQKARGNRYRITMYMHQDHLTVGQTLGQNEYDTHGCSQARVVTRSTTTLARAKTSSTKTVRAHLLHLWLPSPTAKLHPTVILNPCGPPHP